MTVSALPLTFSSTNSTKEEGVKTASFPTTHLRRLSESWLMTCDIALHSAGTLTWEPYKEIKALHTQLSAEKKVRAALEVDAAAFKRLSQESRFCTIYPACPLAIVWEEKYNQSQRYVANSKTASEPTGTTPWIPLARQ